MCEGVQAIVRSRGLALLDEGKAREERQMVFPAAGAKRTLLLTLMLPAMASLAVACSGSAAAPDLSARGAAAAPAALPADGSTGSSTGSSQGEAAVTPAPIAGGIGNTGANGT